MGKKKEVYDATKFERPPVTVDIIVFAVQHNELQILLVKRGINPFRGMWALPGGFVKMEESIEESAKRELFEETRVKDVYLEQLYTFGEPKRDPRTRVITVAYFALIDNPKEVKLRASTDVSEAQWFPAYKLPQLAFDHKEIITYGIQRLKWKMEYTTVGFTLLPKTFTLSQLQDLYRIVCDLLPALKGCPSGNSSLRSERGFLIENPTVSSDGYPSDSSHTNQQSQRCCSQRFRHKLLGSRSGPSDSAV